MVGFELKRQAGGKKTRRAQCRKCQKMRYFCSYNGFFCNRKFCYVKLRKTAGRCIWRWCPEHKEHGKKYHGQDGRKTEKSKGVD